MNLLILLRLSFHFSQSFHLFITVLSCINFPFGILADFYATSQCIHRSCGQISLCRYVAFWVLQRFRCAIVTCHTLTKVSIAARWINKRQTGYFSSVCTVHTLRHQSSKYFFCKLHLENIYVIVGALTRWWCSNNPTCTMRSNVVCRKRKPIYIYFVTMFSGIMLLCTLFYIICQDENCAPSVCWSGENVSALETFHYSHGVQSAVCNYSKCQRVTNACLTFSTKLIFCFDGIHFTFKIHCIAHRNYNA